MRKLTALACPLWQSRAQNYIFVLLPGIEHVGKVHVMPVWCGFLLRMLRLQLQPLCYGKGVNGYFGFLSL